MIVESEPEESPLKFIVLKLGGLHMLISFLGSIGYTMADSGLCEVFETIFRCVLASLYEVVSVGPMI